MYFAAIWAKAWGFCCMALACCMVAFIISGSLDSTTPGYRLLAITFSPVSWSTCTAKSIRVPWSVLSTPEASLSLEMALIFSLLMAPSTRPSMAFCCSWAASSAGGGDIIPSRLPTVRASTFRVVVLSMALPACRASCMRFTGSSTASALVMDSSIMTATSIAVRRLNIFIVNPPS